MVRVAKRILLVLACLLLAGFVAWTIWYQISTRRLEAVLEEARAAGYPLTLEALAGEAIPDEANAAVLYREAFAFLEEHPANVVGGVELFDDYEGDMEAVSAAGREALPDYADALDRVARAGEMPLCRFRPGTEDPPMGAVFGVDGLLCARIALSLEDQDVLAAERDLITLRELARAVGGKDLLASELLEMSLRAGLTHWTRKILPISPEPLALWRRVGIEVRQEHLREGLRGEIAFVLDLVNGEGGITARQEDWRLRYRWLTRPYLKGWTADAVQILMRIRAAATGSYPEAKLKVDALEEESRVEFPDDWNPVPGVVAVLRQGARQASDETITAIGARLLDHRRLHGSWPAALSDLAGDPVPLDPLTEKPFQLTREEGGLLLSSPDPDGGRWLLPD